MAEIGNTAEGKMEREAETQAYLNGLLHMASACSDWIGCSEVTAFLCGEDPAAELAADCGIDVPELRLLQNFP